MNIKSSLLVLTALLGVSTSLFAFPCFITIVKDSCWTNYNVKVDVIDAENERVLTSINIPKGSGWSRKSFDAHPKQRIMLRAQFNPHFWDKNQDKYYYATRYWALPDEIVGDTMAWNVGACYPKNFSSVPLPPDATSNCQCDNREIPQVQPE